MSLRRYLRQLRLLVRGRPQTARDVIPRWEDYLRLQREEYLSHESDVAAWAGGLRRFVRLAFAEVPRSARVLDCACGDGVGLDALRGLGFREVVGVEISEVKAERALALGFRVEVRDMHDLSVFGDGTFDCVLSSHTLEHAWEPSRAVQELRRVLAPEGALHAVLPYPDPGERNERAHAAKYELGTDRDDGGAGVRRFFEERGFRVASSRRDTVREPELWLHLRKA